MATDVTYNDVVLHNVTTKQWQEDSVYDDSGNPYRRYRLRFQCLYHDQDVERATTYIRDTGAADGFLVQLAAIRQHLLEPRHYLSVVFDGQQVLFVAPSSNNEVSADCDSGPKPQTVEVVKVANRTAHIAFAIDACLPDDAPPSSQPRDVLSHRWAVQEEIDDKFFMTRTITGRLRLRATPVNPDDTARSLVALKVLPYGFRRDRIRYAVANNGLDCDYEIVDKQVHTSAPRPASRMDVKVNNSTQLFARFMSECVVRLEGAPNVPKQFLIGLGVRVAMNRLDIWRWPDPANHAAILRNSQTYSPDGFILRAFEVNDMIGDGNTVEVRIAVDRAGTKSIDFWRKLLGRRLSDATPWIDSDGKTHNLVSIHRGYDSSISKQPDVLGYPTEIGIPGQTPPNYQNRPAANLVYRCYANWRESPNPDVILPTHMRSPGEPEPT